MPATLNFVRRLSRLVFAIAILCIAQAANAGELVPVPGGTLYVEENRRGDPLVLIHGGLVDRRMWVDQRRALGKYARVIAYDLRGFGRSSFPQPQMPFSHIEDLRALLDDLHIERATLIGLSLGGQIAIEFALEHPERVRSLVLTSASLRGYPAPRLPESVTVYNTLNTKGVDAAIEAWLSHPFFATGRARPHYDDRMRHMLRDNVRNWTADKGAINAIWPAFSPIERLSEIRAPTLVIAGGSDAAHIVAIAHLLSARIPGAQSVIFTGVGHHLNMEIPTKFNRTVVDFIRSNRA